MAAARAALDRAEAAPDEVDLLMTESGSIPIVVLTLGATLLPAWRVTRGRPAEAALAVE